jgi:hypothetical protein
MRLHLSIDVADRLICVPVWQFRRNLWGGSHPVLSGGLLYVPRIADEFHPHNVVPWTQMDVYDQASGQHYAKAKPALDDSFHPLPLVASRDHLVFSDTGDPQWIRDAQQRPQVAFIAKGDRPKVINRVDFPRKSRLHCEPLLDGKRMYVRLDRDLICLSSDTPAGKAYEDQQRAALIFGLIGEHPALPPVTIPTPIPGFRATATLPVNDLMPDLPPDRWLMAGPFPRQAQPGLPAIFADPLAAPPQAGAAVAWGDATLEAAFLAENCYQAKGRSIVGAGDTTVFRPGRAIDLLATIARKPNRTCFFATILRTDDPCTMRFAMRSMGVTCWLAGKPIKDQELVRFAPGAYPLVARYDQGSIPPFGQPLLNATFAEAPDPRDTEEDWLERVRRFKDQLEYIRDQVPERTERAKSLLEWLAPR